ncbi:hypothetical protein PUNSTDRAFT_95511 [Punctularia strigosozonata HHB-11173 SS5]|uniref:uncharacterized protein n=1 Tax=Punctularia strigosozonata (strain HHB-11173) TaxID=741275 RepID=UPI0004416C2A|nr:uncharacterized protein PUNSTDRAFT_95511 [Punctularia strigosozonata HHB-11173 SS5]EIN14015.1 hypothetical protein PUNSTDRAFT_95511 [Punctularia strigosozonata HHB-11173 SS5]
MAVVAASASSRPPAPSRKPRWLAFLDRTNVTVTSITACFLLYSRSAGIAYFCIGAVACSLSVKVVKKALRQPRPMGATHKISYGMPSTHSATISYYATFILLACAHSAIHPTLPAHPLTRIIPPLIVLPWALAIAASRVWLGHHTGAQVGVGCAYGVAWAAAWYHWWTHYGIEYGRILEQFVNSHI